MRISDWSSDVCSSDLPRYEQGGIYEAIARARTKRLYDLVWSSGSAHAPFHARNVRLIVSLGVPVPGSVTDAELSECREGLMGMHHSLGLHAQELRPGGLLALIDELTSPTTAHETDIHAWNHPDRSEAHTSELQSLISNSYAVFC